MNSLRPYDVEKIIEDRIENGLSLTSLATKYSVRWETVKKTLVETNNFHDARKAQKINTWDYDFFDRRNPVTAYWAGFCFADGCVSLRKYGVRLHATVANKDSGYIEEFARTINFPLQKIISSKNNTKVLQVNRHDSQAFLDSLAYWGIVPRKSYNFHPPQISQELLPHFLRGWFDGDGHLAIGYRNQRFEVVGNSEAMLWYEEKLRELGFDGHINHIRPKEKCWSRILISGKLQIRYVAEILDVFCISNPMLLRKWNPVLLIARLC